MAYDWTKLYKKYKVLEVKGTVIYEDNVIPDELTVALTKFSEVALADKFKELTEENAEFVLVWQLNQLRALLGLKPLTK